MQDKGSAVTIAATQTPDFVAAVDNALEYALHEVDRASKRKASLVCFPECFLQGYALKRDHEAAKRLAVDLDSISFAKIIGRFPIASPMIVLGLIEAAGKDLYITAAVIHRQKLVGRYRKAHLLPSEFIFRPGRDTPLFDAAGLGFGINICNDANFPEAAHAVAAMGAKLLVLPANNMLQRDTAERAREMHNSIRGERCRESGLWLISSDVTGERDGRISWGPTALLNPQGAVVAQLLIGEPGLLVVEVPV